MIPARRALALPALALALAAGQPGLVARAADRATTAAAVDCALTLVQRAEAARAVPVRCAPGLVPVPAASGSAAAGQAEGVIAVNLPDEAGLLDDLRYPSPTHLADAESRLRALQAAFAVQPAPHPDAPEKLRKIFQDAAGPPPAPSPLEEILGRIIAAILSIGWLAWLTIAALVAGLVTIAVLVARAAGPSARGWADAGGEAEARRRQRLAADHFAAADRLSAAGDLAAALRELAGGVSAALGGPDTWESSPYTAREIFGRAPAPETLRPLLLPYERSSFGDHVPDAAAYAAAAEAARPFRKAA